jgi:SMI1 / KNR4 family (SUKH-1)
VSFPVGEDRIEEAESQLGRTLPAALRDRLMRDNGGEIEVDGYPGDDPIWSLHPVWDPSDRRRAARTANHIVSETREGHERGGDLPAGSTVIAENGTGDLLLVLVDADNVVWWDHETGEVESVVVDWSSL